MVIKATKLFNLYTLLSKRKRTIKKSIRCVYKGITKKKKIHFVKYKISLCIVNVFTIYLKAIELNPKSSNETNKIKCVRFNFTLEIK